MAPPISMGVSVFNFILAKRTTIRFGVSLVLLVSSWVSATEDLVSRGPDGAGIKKVAIYSYDGMSRNTIYANGRMQAPVDIVYELATGYAVKSVILKTLNTGAPLSDWVISDKNNGYLPGLVNSKESTKSSAVLRRYISTDGPRAAAVCVELIASKAGSADSVQSTCDGGTQDASVYITAIPPVSLSKDDIELTSWQNSTILHVFDTHYGVRASEIKEQALKTINYYPRIRSFEIDHQLTSNNDGILSLNNSLISQYYIGKKPKEVGHIMSWVAHPNSANKIRFIENVGIDRYDGMVLEREIPYSLSGEQKYILSFITYLLRDDKFVYYYRYDRHLLCGEIKYMDGTRKCQDYIGRVNETAPIYNWDAGDLELNKVERSRGTITLIDEYGNASQFTFGVRPASNLYGVPEIFIE